jgi:hypothetical protein
MITLVATTPKVAINMIFLEIVSFIDEPSFPCNGIAFRAAITVYSDGAALSGR